MTAVVVSSSLTPTHDPHATCYQAVDFIETYTGQAFWPLDPAPQMVSIIDIAHALSNQCRYSGATTAFYSTAQHCCLLANYVEKLKGSTPHDCLQILMHDAAEAYLVDVPRPIKQFMPQFREWDKKITNVVRSWYGFGDVPIPEWQDELDSRIIVDERAQLLSDSGLDWMHDPEHGVFPLGIFIEPWIPALAEQQFLMLYASFTKKIYGKHQYLRSGWGVSTLAAFQEFPFRTGGSDIDQKGAVDPRIVTDLVEVDLRGNVGRVALRSPDGLMIRNTAAGSFPRPAWRWIHGVFTLVAPGIDDTQAGINEAGIS